VRHRIRDQEDVRQTQRREQHERDDQSADHRPHAEAEHGIHASERTFLQRLAQPGAPPREQRQDCNPGESRNDPAQHPKDRSGSGAFPMRTDPLRNQQHRPEAEEPPRKNENLRDGAAQESTDCEHQDQNDQRPVHPGETREVWQVR